MSDTREELWAKVHDLGCNHSHDRADECPICRAQFAAIIEMACAKKTKECEG